MAFALCIHNIRNETIINKKRIVIVTSCAFHIVARYPFTYPLRRQTNAMDFPCANKDKCRYDFYSNRLILFELNSSLPRMRDGLHMPNRASFVVLSLPLDFVVSLANVWYVPNHSAHEIEKEIFPFTIGCGGLRTTSYRFSFVSISLRAISL